MHQPQTTTPKQPPKPLSRHPLPPTSLLPLVDDPDPDPSPPSRPPKPTEKPPPRHRGDPQNPSVSPSHSHHPASLTRNHSHRRPLNPQIPLAKPTQTSLPLSLVSPSPSTTTTPSHLCPPLSLNTTTYQRKPQTPPNPPWKPTRPNPRETATAISSHHRCREAYPAADASPFLQASPSPVQPHQKPQRHTATRTTSGATTETPASPHLATSLSLGAKQRPRRRTPPKLVDLNPPPFPLSHNRLQSTPLLHPKQQPNKPRIPVSQRG